MNIINIADAILNISNARNKQYDKNCYCILYVYSVWHTRRDIGEKIRQNCVKLFNIL